MTTISVDAAQEVLWGIGVNSDTRLDAMLDLLVPADDASFWRVLSYFWPDCDDTWNSRHRLARQLRKRGLGIAYLGAEESGFLDALPPKATVFRGCSKPRVKGFAWTTDKAVALGFARGHRGLRVPNPVVAEARVDKRLVYTAMTQRGESELLIDPKFIQSLTITPFNGPKQ